MNSNHSKMSSKFLRRSNESGVALIAVLWVLLLLCSLAASAAYVARANALLTHSTLDLARADAAADAAIMQAVAELSNERAMQHPRTDGSLQTSEFRDASVGLSINEEDGRIDVNTANDDLIMAFLESQGLTSNVAETMLAALRERTSGSRGRLAVVEELRQIPEWKAQNLDCWRGALTVYSGLPGVNGRDAVAAVSRTLGWARDHHFGSRERLGIAPTGFSAESRSVVGDVLRIKATATVSNVTATHEWVGRVTGDKQKPFLTMRWERIFIPADCNLPQQVD
jgi:hypothetical protein